MDDQLFEKYLADRYEDQIGWYDKKAALNKRRFAFAKTIVIAGSIAVPVILSFEAAPVWIASLLAALVAITEGLSGAFKYHENWMNYRTTCETLRKERHLLEAGLEEYGSSDNPKALFVQRVENVISRENTLWLKNAKDSSKSQKHDPS